MLLVGLGSSGVAMSGVVMKIFKPLVLFFVIRAYFVPPVSEPSKAFNYSIVEVIYAVLVYGMLKVVKTNFYKINIFAKSLS